MNAPLTVHMIGNAHLDPVWLWRWQRGADEALSTCRTACDILDEFPRAVFTRGEAWVYEQVRQRDPDTFTRIRRHIEAGRWCAVGGWWIQADTNLPTAHALAKQIEIGHEWFRTHLGLTEFPVAYLPDTFGHTAFLPRILREAGQGAFTFMRPSAEEMTLPTPLFRWRSPDDHEVLAFRIVGGYLLNVAGDRVADALNDKVQRVVDSTPPGIGHAMCFYGVGDHGGGPTRRMVQWIHEHQDFAPGVRLEFSDPHRFFEAVRKQSLECPEYCGELGPHAIGCYSVCGDLKRAMRRAELSAAVVEALQTQGIGEARAALQRAWRTICFNQFHDILPGSCIREAVTDALEQIGGVQSELNGVLYCQSRERDENNAFGRIGGQRLHVRNMIARPWRGVVHAAVWSDGHTGPLELRNADDTAFPTQSVETNPLASDGRFAQTSLRFHLSLAPREEVCFKIAPAACKAPSESENPLRDWMMETDRLRITFGRFGLHQIEDLSAEKALALFAAPLRFECFQDFSDTWGHGLLSLQGPAIGAAHFGAPDIVESGSVETTIRQLGNLGAMRAVLWCTLRPAASVVRLSLQIAYVERGSVLKAIVNPHGGLTGAEQRVCGGWLERPLDQREYSLAHAIRFHSRFTGACGLVLPDSFAADVGTFAVRPTLIRNNFYAYSTWKAIDPEQNRDVSGSTGTDEGPHALRLALTLGESATRGELESLLDEYRLPPEVWHDYHDASRVAAFE